MKLIDLSTTMLLLCLAALVISCQQDSKKSKVEEIAYGPISIDTAKIERYLVHCSIRAIAPIDEQTCWYAGSRGQFGFTEDGGETWHIDSIQHPDQENLEFRSIAHANGNTFLLSVASPALLFKTTNKGKSWNVVYQENDSLAFYDAMSFWDNQEGIAMGDPTDGCLSIIRTKDGGDHWEKISCDQLPPTEKGEAAFAASNSNIALYNDHVWIVTGGKKARVFHSGDRGDNWSVAETPIVQGGQMTGIFGSDFYDEKTGLVIGGDWEKKEINRGNKAMTQDGGRSWQLIADGAGPSYRSCVQFIGDSSAQEIIAVGIPGISFSSDGGKTWEKVSNESFYTVRKSGKVLWLAGANKLAVLEI